jgi:signal transduction histidine kinase/sugar phosphate isomerase/epimerase
MMHCGFQTVAWGRRIDDLDHLLGIVAACGYEGVEFAQNHCDIHIRENGIARPIDTFARLKERLHVHGLQLLGLVGGTLEDRMAFCGDDRSAYLFLDAWFDRYAAAVACEAPFTLALHPHWSMPVRKLKHVDAILAKIPSPHLKVIIDTAHAIVAEDDPVAAVRKYHALGRLAAVHIKDWKPDYGRWSHRFAHGFCLPGEGIVPVDRVMDVLREIGFDGWVIMEQDHNDVSPEDTALKCAHWAAKWSGNGFRSFAPDAQQVSGSEIRNPLPPDIPLDQIRQELEIVRKLALAPVRGPDVFYPMASSLLRDAFGAEAVMLWSYNPCTDDNPCTDEFNLLAASLAGHLPQECKTRFSREESLSGGIIEEARVLLHDLSDPAIRPLFGDQEFLKSLRSRWMMTVPVFNSSNSHHIRYIFSIFVERDLPTQDGRLAKSEQLFAEHYADLISVWADYLTDEMCSAAAGATAHLCGEIRSGVIPFVNALMSHIERQFGCERASVFLVDESQSRLEPVGETNERIEWDETVPANEHFYRKGEGMTGRTWEEREMLFSNEAHKGKSFEKTEGIRRECLAAPLARRGGHTIGVVRLHNRISRGSAPTSTAFTDDDAAKLDAIIQTALPHLDLLINQRRQSFAFTRLAHELQNPLVGIAGAADFLRESLKAHGITDIKRAFGADYIDDIFSYQALMSRLVDNASLFGSIIDEMKPEFERMDLATMVVIPVCNQLRALLKKHRLSADRIHIPQFQGVIPWLFVDRLMFQQVFFNLFVNAIKYHDGADSFRVNVRVGIEGEPRNPVSYLIEVEDWGIGLDEGDETGDTMFLAGVRGQYSSRHHDVSGTGVGLAVVKAVVTAHCGTVSFSSSRKPTTVTIRLPGALRHTSPKRIS